MSAALGTLDRRRTRRRRCRRTIAGCSTATDCSRPCCVRAGGARFLEAHLARLAQGCARLGIPLRRRWRSCAPRSRRRWRMAPPLAMLKIIVTRGSAHAPRLRARRAPKRARRIVSLWPDAALPDARRGGRRRCAVATVAARRQPRARRHQTSQPARERAGRGGGRSGRRIRALLLDASGHVVSGAMSNVFIVRAGRVLTPPRGSCGVAGVMRGIVLRECAALGIAAAERTPDAR